MSFFFFFEFSSEDDGANRNRSTAESGFFFATPQSQTSRSGHSRASTLPLSLSLHLPVDSKYKRKQKLTCRRAAEREAETAAEATRLVRLRSECGGPPAAEEETSTAMRILSVIMLSVSMVAFLFSLCVEEFAKVYRECRAGWRGARGGV